MKKQRAKSKGQQQNGSGVVLTEERLREGASSRGGFSAKQLDLLGEPWPPLAGWKARVLGSTISRRKFAKFVALSDIEMAKADARRLRQRQRPALLRPAPFKGGSGAKIAQAVPVPVRMAGETA